MNHNYNYLNKRKTIHSKVWLSQKEIFKYLGVLVWIFNAKPIYKDLKILVNNILHLWKRSGSNFTFLYLKECCRLIVRALSGVPEDNSFITLGKIIVKRDRHGIPTIIPLPLRKFLYAKRESRVQLLLSLLSLYRVMPSVQKPKFNTITDPFNGTSEMLDQGELVRAISDLEVRMKLKSPRLLRMESAGPYGIKSTWCSNADLIALDYHGDQSSAFVQLMSRSWKGILILLWLVFLSVLATPFKMFLRQEPMLGRLAVVLDQAGKGRLVAITNYWIQVCLKPLHDSIFAFLRTINHIDGTFDQHYPLNLLIDNEELTEKFYCYDLSAATDRLPVKLQVQILNLLLGDGFGDLWAKLLDITWFYKKSKFKYSVGQPMGAYSSWAMLALSHHIIVRVAALRCGHSKFKDYAILGDDIVIRNKAVAEEYLNLMTCLGVSINQAKSVISKDFAEFAKVLKGPYVNYTPVGPGLILRYIRDRGYLGALLLELNKLKIIGDIHAILNMLYSQKWSNTDYFKLYGVWSTIGPGVANKVINWNDVSVSTEAIFQNFITAKLGFCPRTFHRFNALRQLAIDDVRDSWNKFWVEWDHFYKRFGFTLLKDWPLILFDTLFKVISPPFWVYFLSFFRDLRNIEKRFTFVNSFHHVGAFGIVNDTTQLEKDLWRMKNLDVSSIDWCDKRSIKLQQLKFKKLVYYMQIIHLLDYHLFYNKRNGYPVQFFGPSVEFCERQWSNTLKEGLGKLPGSKFGQSILRKKLVPMSPILVSRQFPVTLDQWNKSERFMSR